MKTAREILLDRHRHMERRLEAVRAEALANVSGQCRPAAAAPFAVLNWPAIWWRELILPSRRLWSGLAAMWVLLLIINVAQRDPVSSVTGKPASVPAVMMSWQAQQRWMNELLAERVPIPEADRPRNDAPRPRTQNDANLYG
jgi:hypothetical protein